MTDAVVVDEVDKDADDPIPEPEVLFTTKEDRLANFHVIRKRAIHRLRWNAPQPSPGVVGVMEAHFGTPSFAAYTWRVFHLEEPMAAGARLLGVSRQSMYRGIEAVEATFETHMKLRISGEGEDGIVAATLWREYLEKVEFPIAKLWTSDRPILEAQDPHVIMRALEQKRIETMSVAGLKRLEGHLIADLLRIEEQLKRVRELTPHTAQS